MADSGAATQAVERIVTAMLGMGGSNAFLTEQGGNLLMGLTVIAIAWTAMKVMMEGEGIQKLIAEFLMIIFLWGFASMFVSPPSSEENWGNKLMGGFDSITQRVMAGAMGLGEGATANPTQAIMNALGNSLYVASRMFTEPNLTSAQAPSGRANSGGSLSGTEAGTGTGTGTGAGAGSGQ